MLAKHETKYENSFPGTNLGAGCTCVNIYRYVPRPPHAPYLKPLKCSNQSSGENKKNKKRVVVRSSWHRKHSVPVGTGVISPEAHYKKQGKERENNIPHQQQTVVPMDSPVTPSTATQSG
ncbi:hypothetical protein BaRGS_00002192, partial [Batillaria attramentaria]